MKRYFRQQRFDTAFFFLPLIPIFVDRLSNAFMQQKLLLGSRKFDLVIQRLCHQLIETHDDFNESAIIGLQPRGIYLADRIQHELKKILPTPAVPCGHLDITFFRDDFRRRDTPLVANSTHIDFIIENKKVILVDDVLYTGRTIRSGLDAMMAFGRPERVELLVLVDRRYSRHLPIEPDYIGIQVDSIASQSVKVTWKETEGEDAIYLLNS